MYEYRAMTAKTIQGVAVEANKRAQEGWRLIAMAESKGGLGAHEYGLVFEREVKS